MDSNTKLKFRECQVRNSFRFIVKRKTEGIERKATSRGGKANGTIANHIRNAGEPTRG